MPRVLWRCARHGHGHRDLKELGTEHPGPVYGKEGQIWAFRRSTARGCNVRGRPVSIPFLRINDFLGQQSTDWWRT